MFDFKSGKNEAIDRVKHAISMLFKDSAHIIQLKFKEQKSYKEIAQDTGFSESNVGYKLHHIIKDLSEELKGEGYFK